VADKLSDRQVRGRLLQELDAARSALLCTGQLELSVASPHSVAQVHHNTHPNLNPCHCAATPCARSCLFSLGARCGW